MEGTYAAWSGDVIRVDVLVVGAGFAGSVVAERLAAAGLRVLIIDRRSHPAGNAYDETDAQGVLVHRYGPHIFHTNSQKVFRYLSLFTSWRRYEHRVMAYVRGKLLPFPINLDTLNQLYGKAWDEKSARAFLERVRIRKDAPRTSEDVVLGMVGEELCDLFYRGYTRKQWGCDLSDLKASVAARIPVRLNHDDRYFEDRYQAMPEEGYTAMFHRMLDHERITTALDTDFRDIHRTVHYRHLVYTGPIDSFFSYRYGPLPYRSLRFEHLHYPGVERLQPVATINYPNDHAYTRVTEFKQLTGQKHSGTSLVREYPQTEGDPYYPVPNDKAMELACRYAKLARRCRDVTFVGRLAEYRYYNMDQVVAAALKAAEKVKSSLGVTG